MEALLCVSIVNRQGSRSVSGRLASLFSSKEGAPRGPSLYGMALGLFGERGRSAAARAIATRDVTSARIIIFHSVPSKLETDVAESSAVARSNEHNGRCSATEARLLRQTLDLSTLPCLPGGHRDGAMDGGDAGRWSACCGPARWGCFGVVWKRRRHLVTAARFLAEVGGGPRTPHFTSISTSPAIEQHYRTSPPPQ
jgi:hypothetical protein